MVSRSSRVTRDGRSREKVGEGGKLKLNIEGCEEPCSSSFYFQQPDHMVSL
jgi:hypothetical protein